MKDDYKRRRQAERALIKRLPDVDPSLVHTSIHQEYLQVQFTYSASICTQGNDFLVVSSDSEWLRIFELHDGDTVFSFDTDSVSEISKFSDDRLIPKRWRIPACHRVNEEEINSTSVEFIAPDVIAFVDVDKAKLSTWNVRSGTCLESKPFGGTLLGRHICKITDEFAVGSDEGHVCIYGHEEGCNLEETGRIWKAHMDKITSLSCHGDILITTSNDWSARVWSLKSRKRLAVLNHDDIVYHTAVSQQYIVTCGQPGRPTEELGELRIYRNGDGYPLLKILHAHEEISRPLILDDNRIVFLLRDFVDENERPLTRNSILVFDIDGDCVRAALKVGCRYMYKFVVLTDGRIVVIGYGSCRGVIATFPRHVRKLIVPRCSSRRRMCSLI